MSEDKKETQKIKFRYVIPDHLQDTVITGAYGGVTPRGHIAVAFYNERPAIPKSETNEVVDGQLAPPKPQEVEFGGDYVRLVQSSIVMDVATAREIRDWLALKVKEIEERVNAVKPGTDIQE